ncbi:MAG: Gfo/Idh/MocA family oxidoreductase, partial [Oscillospiraceae bacterium]
YFHSWYRNNDITQGQFLQKATHDLDYINFILGIKPVELCAMTSKRVFNGSEKAGIRCDECPKAETCPENPKAILDRNDEVFGDYCCYGEDCKNEDSGSVLIRYETGMHVNYTQNFYIKKKAEKRGARFLGDEGTLEFDWYRNQIKIYNHYNARIDTFQYDESLGSHFGGDDRLVDNFYNLVAGKATQSIATFEEGLDSALLCIRAKQSAEQSKFMKIQE